LTAAFLVGWSIGGFIFGVIGDRIGRTGTMILTILIYAVFTGLSGLVQSWPAYAFMRFMTGLGVGGEWAAGAAMVAEVFPARSRPMALGLLQALSGVGNMMASVVTFLMADLGWRWAYAVGACAGAARAVDPPVGQGAGEMESRQGTGDDGKGNGDDRRAVSATRGCGGIRSPRC